MADALPLPEKRKYRAHGLSYVGTVALWAPGEAYALTVEDVERFHLMEYRNRKRCRRAEDAVTEVVDFLGQLIKQAWACHICGEPMDPKLRAPNPLGISCEHDPAMSVAHEHTRRTVRGAHAGCNHHKGSKSDTPRAAKIKRVQSDEQRHASHMALKARHSKAVYQRKLREEKAAKGKQITGRSVLKGRGFPTNLTRGFDGRVAPRVK